MHLAFLYIKKFKSLSNVQLNLDPRFSFEYVNGKLFLRSFVNEFPRNAFSLGRNKKSNVIDCITAIVGENGTGKTTIASFMANMLQGKSVGEYIAVFVSIGRRYVPSVKYHVHYELHKNLCDCDRDYLEVKNFPAKESVRVYPGIDSIRHNVCLMYYSPFFTTERTFRGSPLRPKNGPRISADNDILLNDLKRDYRIIDISSAACMESAFEQAGAYSPMVAVEFAERKRILDFLRGVSASPNLEDALELPYKPSNNAALAIIDKDAWESLEYICTTAPHSTPNGDPQFIDEDEPGTWRNVFARLAPKVAHCVFYKGLLLYIGLRLMDRSSYVDGSNNLSELGRCLGELLTDIETFIAHGENVEEKRDIVLSRIIELSCDDESLYAVHTFLNMLTSAEEYFDGDVFRLSLTDRKSERYQAYLNLLEAYLKCRPSRDFMVFRFDMPFSSGEMAYISMWARIYDAIGQLSRPQWNKKAKNILLFIDEAETTLHPLWQRELVERMVLFLNTFAKGMGVQLIFSTHSPMLLSDVYKGGVCILLPADDSRFAEMKKSWALLSNTFGANIFDLYRLSFFLQKGTVGSFAQKKIDDLVKKVHGILVDKKRRMISQCEWRVAEMVGDPQVRKYFESIKPLLGAALEKEGSHEET